ncbi:uncharacterized protein BX664DRAFT_317196 [Halteromyces radiatus]|uniref:uncharacterized protein n=1 Tax=Halteromyces radiatus TaxID=101107 RepID=UPI00221EF786|nr:uncharacterized protein BX664DRAFT_317196 [Halteromyces radiatus]KAI8081292.1 hypothetical protein BX664DRAFT_317196 [Halteromyces radiatus]
MKKARQERVSVGFVGVIMVDPLVPRMVFQSMIQYPNQNLVEVGGGRRIVVVDELVKIEVEVEVDKRGGLFVCCHSYCQRKFCSLERVCCHGQVSWNDCSNSVQNELRLKHTFDLRKIKEFRYLTKAICVELGCYLSLILINALAHRRSFSKSKICVDSRFSLEDVNNIFFLQSADYKFGRCGV